MKIQGLKMIADKGWNPASTYNADNGRTIPLPANHKLICQDENFDIVNLTLITETPFSFKQGEELKNLRLSGSVSKTAFGWALKGTIDSPVK